MGTVNVVLGEDTRLNLILGQQLENAVTEVVFDFSAWQTTYGAGTLALSVQRPGDEMPYAVTLTTSGTDATWSVTNLDTAYKGVGHIQLTYTVGSAIKKSVVYKFTVYESLGANGEYPSPGQTWQEEMEQEITDVKADLNDTESELNSILISEATASIWASGGISSQTGYDTTSTTRIRTSSITNKINKVIGDSGYKYIIFAYSGSTYVGAWDGSQLKKEATWHTGATNVDIIGNYTFRFVLAFSNDSAISASDGVHLVFYHTTDTTLSLSGKIADAKTVGDIFGGALIARRTLTSADDLDNITDTGLYDYLTASMPSNRPDIAVGGVIVVQSFNNKTVQTYYGKDSNGYNATARRIKTSSGWADWDINKYPEFKVRNVLTSADDLDDIVTTGIYKYIGTSVPANAPSTSSGVVNVYNVEETICQTYTNTTESYFRIRGTTGTWYDWTKGTLTVKTLTSSDDLNDLHENGVYDYLSASIPTNAPDMPVGGVLTVQSINGKTEQIYYGKDSSGYNATARRIKTSTGWSSWELNKYPEFKVRRVLTSADDLNDILITGIYKYMGISVPLNAPNSASGVVNVYCVDETICQMYTNTVDIYFRIRGTTGTWYDWTKGSSETSISALPVMTLTGDISQMSKDNAVSLNYSIFGQTGTAEVKWQGSSSLRYPKKNYTIKFDVGFDGWEKWATFVNAYRDSVGNISRIPTISRWGTQKKYVAKANWVDPSMIRNVVCARLWGKIVKERVDNGDVIDGRASSPNYGAIDGFPIEIKINGVSTGLYTFNIPKDKWTFAMGNANTEYLIAGEGNANLATQWKALAVLDGDDYSVEYAEDGVLDSTIATSLNVAIQAAIDAGANWETTLAPYVDIDSVFDYFIFTCCINNHDALARNILYGTYDGVKWFLSAYDMDTTFGSDPYGSSWFDVVNDRNQFAEASQMHRLAYLMYTHSKTKLKARYAELRSGILSDANVWHELSQFMVDIPSRDISINNNMWKDMPGTSTANISQYMDYYKMHCEYLDAEIESL